MQKIVFPLIRQSRHTLSYREEIRSSYSRKFDVKEIKREREEKEKEKEKERKTKRDELKMPANMNYSF